MKRNKTNPAAAPTAKKARPARKPKPAAEAKSQPCNTMTRADLAQDIRDAVRAEMAITVVSRNEKGQLRLLRVMSPEEMREDTERLTQEEEAARREEAEERRQSAAERAPARPAAPRVAASGVAEQVESEVSVLRAAILEEQPHFTVEQVLARLAVRIDDWLVSRPRERAS